MSINIQEYILNLDYKCPSSEALFKAPSRIPVNLTELLFTKAKTFELESTTKYLSYHILSRLYYANAPDVIVYVSISLSTKCNQIIPVTYKSMENDIKITRNEFIQMEKRALSQLNYKILEFSLFDWMSALLELSFQCTSINTRSKIRNIGTSLCDFIYKEKDLLSNHPVGLIAASILNTSLTLLTRLIGDFPPIILLCKSLSQSPESISYISHLILNLALGTDFCSKFNF